MTDQTTEKPVEAPRAANALTPAMPLIQVTTIKEAQTMALNLEKAGQMLPKDFRGQPGTIFALVLQANRWRMDPVSLAQSAYVVGDKVGYEAKVFSAVVNSMAPLTKRLRYRYEGELMAPDEVTTKAGAKRAVPTGSRTCTVSGWLIGEDEPLEYTTPAIGDIQPKNSTLWTADPDRQLAYYAVRAWARLYVPEVVLGIYTADELQDSMVNVTPAQPSARQLAEALDSKPAAKPAQAAAQQRDDTRTIDATAKPAADDPAYDDTQVDRRPADTWDGFGKDDDPAPVKAKPEPEPEPEIGTGPADDHTDMTEAALEAVKAAKRAFKRRLTDALTRADVDDAVEWLHQTEGWLHFNEQESQRVDELVAQRRPELPGASK